MLRSWSVYLDREVIPSRLIACGSYSMVKKKKSSRRHVVRASVSNMELAKARSALHLELVSRGEKLGELEVGRGSFFWTGRNRHRSKRIPWNRFARMMDDLAYGEH